jgi:protein-S-isoprenylcysteine O-methyltransferase Ste14
MIEWINFILMLVFPVLSSYYYAQSVSVIQLERAFFHTRLSALFDGGRRKIGPDVYKKCEQYSIVSLFFFIMICITYLIYYFYPLQVPLPQTFPISGWILAPIAALFTIPLGYEYYIAVKDAGERTIHPKLDGELYGGIYTIIRHPQAGALLPIGWILGFILNSPFLVLLSFIWVPAFYLMCLAEEKDLLIRYGDTYREYMKETGFFFPKFKYIKSQI